MVKKLDATALFFGVLLVAYAIGICAWIDSVRNDFCGDIEVWASGEVYEDCDYYGRCQRYIGDRVELPYSVYIKPPEGEFNTGESMHSSKLVEGEEYVIHKKVLPLCVVSYFVEHIPKP